MKSGVALPAGPGAVAPVVRRGAGLPTRARYMLFALPALVVILAVILFPWMFTVFMSLHDWPVVGEPSFVGAGNYLQLIGDTRFLESIWHTFYFTVLAVVLPVIVGVLAAVVFHRAADAHWGQWALFVVAVAPVEDER